MPNYQWRAIKRNAFHTLTCWAMDGEDATKGQSQPGPFPCDVRRVGDSHCTVVGRPSGPYSDGLCELLSGPESVEPCSDGTICHKRRAIRRLNLRRCPITKMVIVLVLEEVLA